jgi:AmiR/NasT family two-component response regulator
MTEHGSHPLEATLNAADEALDKAWITGGDVEAHLLQAKALSEAIGRDPMIEEAKVRLARSRGCTPSEAFDVLRKLSQRSNRKLREVAHEVVQASIARED